MSGSEASPRPELQSLEWDQGGSSNFAMAAPRPSFIDLRSQSQASMASTMRPMRSPRLHVAGEVPPDLSPLDAFALQSRMLAKQLEESKKMGRRMSRLPPLTTESPLIVQGRSDYFRSMSQDSGSERGESPQQGTGLGLKVEDAPVDRPVSMHPRMSRIPPTPDTSIPLPAPLPYFDLSRGRQSMQPSDATTIFGARREESPTPIELQPPSTRQEAVAQLSPLHLTNTTQSPDKLVKKSSFDSTLAPPKPLYAKRSSSLMSSPMESTDEAGSSMASSFHSLPPRKLSSSSSAFSGHAAFSPHTSSFTRSPSIASDASMPLPRPSFNFSRPLSRADSFGLETPPRQASSDSHPFIVADDSANTPISMSSEGFPDHTVSEDIKTPAAPSYIYSKFSLPRGKTLHRNSTIFLDPTQPVSSFHFEQPPLVPPTSNVRSIFQGPGVVGQAPPSPPTRPSSSSRQDGFLEDTTITLPYLDGTTPYSLPKPPMGPTMQPSPSPSRPSTEDGQSSEDGPRGRSSPTTEPPRDRLLRGRTPLSISTSDSASTIKAGARSQNSVSGAGTLTSSADMTAEEHLAKGIACHESDGGSLAESTYHLRHAARMGHPTGMLLYALACRHGWGMRPNPKEAMEWLRKAADCASLEIADDERGMQQQDGAQAGRPLDAGERRTRKAQFALSIYELGVSHMNGWGTDKDAALALRCFEIAGSWGDVDALAESGFCYAKGVGCKKDLRKAAKFYRMAEAKGMSMVGNSWIHKSKYNDEMDKKERKARSKSRTRTMFGLKSSS